MFYREAGQFKATYAADQAIFPIAQDKIGIAIILAVAFLVIPFFGSEYFLTSLMLPFLVFPWPPLASISCLGIAASSALAPERSWPVVRSSPTKSPPRSRS